MIFLLFSSDFTSISDNNLWGSCVTGGGHRVIRVRRLERRTTRCQGARYGVFGRRQRQRSEIHKLRVHRAITGERDRQRSRHRRAGHRPGHGPVRQRPVHCRVGFQELVASTGLADRRHYRIQRQSRVRPGRVSRYDT